MAEELSAEEFRRHTRDLGKKRQARFRSNKQKKMAAQ